MVSPQRHSRAKAFRERLARAARSLRGNARAARKPRKERSFRLLRDVVGALVLVGIVLGATTAFTGGAWPPIVVVESGSMMHDVETTSYGRVGTLDVGDIAVIRAAPDLTRVRLWVDGGDGAYGRPGDVLAFKADGDRANITILHRAITYVEVERVGLTDARYAVRWIDGQTLEFGTAGIYLPELGFDERNGFTPTRGFKPAYSGYITKGDNPVTNFASDQAVNLSRVVEASWIEGTVEGEIPWMGLARLALQLDQTNPRAPNWVRVGNAFAPVELWTCFFALLGSILLVPLSIDTWRLYRRHRARRAEQRAIEEDMRRRDAERTKLAPPKKAAPPPSPPKRRVVEFEPLSR